MYLYLIDSSFIQLAYYNNNLHLLINNKLYCYYNITELHFNEFINSKSKGTYLNKHKKDIFNNYELVYIFNDEIYELITYMWLEDDITKYQFNNTFRLLISKLGKVRKIKKLEE